MKNLNFCRMSVLVTLIIGGSARAADVVLELNYTNNAWGRVNRGCMIDEDRNVYEYTKKPREELKHIAQLGEPEFLDAARLLAQAKAGVFTEKRGTMDGGVWTWSGRLAGVKVILKKTGDLVGSNSAAEAGELVTLINSWCKFNTD